MSEHAPQWHEAWSDEVGRQRAAEQFTAAFGDVPDGVWSAPGRVNLIGEHTDYTGGLVLPFALPHRTFVALRRREDDTVRLVSAQEGRPWEGALSDVAPGTVDGWAGYAVGVAWALREAGHDVGGFDAAITSCVPYGAGLSSSAALEAAVAVALVDTSAPDVVADAGGEGGAAGTDGPTGDDAARAALAAVCIRAENEIAGAPTGGMDQAASLRSREGHALLLDCRSGDVRHIPFDLAAADLALLVIDTRTEHRLVDGQYAARRAACEGAARLLGVETLRDVEDLDAAVVRLREPGLLDGSDEDAETLVRRVRHVVSENARVREVESLLDAGRTAEVGPVLTAAHASLRDDYEVSCHELDVAVDVVIAAGALGGRMVGGGFGGSAIALVHAHDLEQVAGDVAAAFAAEDLSAPAFLVATAAAPAG